MMHDLQILSLETRFLADIGNRWSDGSKHLLLLPVTGLNAWLTETNRFDKFSVL